MWADDAQETARRHFKSGVALFQNGDFTGALAEFEASQRDLPSASSLQNIALCLTRLHRYLPALETLDKLKSDYGSTLSPEDRKAVDGSIRELLQLVGTVTMRVSPPGAIVSINGKPLSAEAARRPIRLSSGEYTFKAEAQFHAPVERTETIAGGDDRTIELVLRPQAAEVEIFASDRDAAIAIDRQPVAFGVWTGPLMPGEHLVQVYKDGFKPFTTRVPVKAGDHIELRPLLGPPDSDAGRSASPANPNEVVAPRGWFALFTANTVVPLYHPDHFKSRDVWMGGSYGVRGGYRFWQNVAFEGLIDIGKQSVGPGEYTPPNAPVGRTTYELSTTRVGGNVRLLTGGRVARLSSVFGVGSVTHKLELGAISATGSEGYFLLEFGAQFNIGHVLLEAAALTYLEGATAIKYQGERIYTDHTIIPQVGVGFRAGYGEWGRW